MSKLQFLKFILLVISIILVGLIIFEPDSGYDNLSGKEGCMPNDESCEKDIDTAIVEIQPLRSEEEHWNNWAGLK